MPNTTSNYTLIQKATGRLYEQV